ncbi:MAG: ABC transporter substrate-binding protein [Armatimonadota bacterium]|nr:ABC transporter substrate-binding protein [Armatimonadota bacterium]
MRHGHVLLLALAVAVAIGAVMTGCGKQSASNEILIGEYGSLTGTTADFGITTKNGIDLAVEEINNAGGVLGKKIRLIIQDDRSDPAEAKTAVTKLVMQDRVAAVLGEVASTRSMAAAPVCQQAGVPMITPSSTNPAVTKRGDYIFRVCFIDDFQGTICAKFAAETLGLKRAAIIKDVKNDYSVGLAKSFTDSFSKLGGQIVGEVSYSEGDTDFSSQITAIRGTKPQIIFVPGYYQEVDLIARKARQLGIKVPLLGGDGWDSSTLIPNSGGALEGSYFSNHYDAAMGGPEVKKFIAAYRKKFGSDPNALAALGYDAMHIMARAIERAGSTDGAKIRDAIAATKNFPGITGSITIDKDRNAVKPGVILQIKGNKFQYVTTVRP